MTAVLAHRTITAVALAEQRLRASDLSPRLQLDRPHPVVHPLARLLVQWRRRAGMGMVTVGLRLVLAGDDLDPV
ncbi:MAG TPA: hypothetical protein VKV06_05915 [Acidimicrobiales bacterium]|nr:hypothetical protein [Acidimicrobiales bacterium]